MATGRIYREIERTPEQAAELNAVRVAFQEGRPGLDDLIESGDYEGPFRQSDLSQLLATLAEIRRERESRGLSIAEVSERSGLEESVLRRLEEGRILDPPVSTLWRYSEAIGLTLRITMGSYPAGAEPVPPG